jgi:hypothetical protein
MSRDPRITVIYTKPIGRVTQRRMRELIPAIPSDLLRHRLRIRVVPAKVVGDGKSGFGFGCFRVVRRAPEIWLAGERPERTVTDAEWAEMLTTTFAHELAHYEQWRDGRPLQERGVAVRARSIVAAMGGG